MNYFVIFKQLFLLESFLVMYTKLFNDIYYFIYSYLIDNCKILL